MIFIIFSLYLCVSITQILTVQINHTCACACAYVRREFFTSHRCHRLFQSTPKFMDVNRLEQNIVAETGVQTFFDSVLWTLPKHENQSILSLKLTTSA